MGRRSHPPPENLRGTFFGYPAEVIADVCCVSIGTAREYKTGTRTPSPAATRLWLLHIAGRIMPDHWTQYRFSTEGKLHRSDPGSTFWVDEDALNAYTYRLQLLRRYQERIDALEKALAEKPRHYLRVPSVAPAVAYVDRAKPIALPAGVIHSPKPGTASGCW